MNDLERTTKMAHSMIAFYGMSDALPNICYYDNSEYGFQKPYSNQTAQIIDEQVIKMVNAPKPYSQSTRRGTTPSPRC